MDNQWAKKNKEKRGIMNHLIKIEGKSMITDLIKWGNKKCKTIHYLSYNKQKSSIKRIYYRLRKKPKQPPFLYNKHIISKGKNKLSIKKLSHFYKK